ncbi:alpha/beta fold hydrolase [Ketobacter sp. MCCC 1A13808]|uniref:alpha/beta fold hydrolase n=1 Tax=Ketobacter sp. MCCC 1A13808 TaxID=2602738 RepID=UPI0012EC14DE|nr:alpha/beta fold hydrolase [Ketobacter sp. MCCC 1A13808]MVF10642.1 alpha/beta fold hydrolase [Ketobacter sp. MCCC 1A13808]
MSSRQIEQSLMVPLSGGQQLHLRRLSDSPDAPAILLLHGLLEDGTVFYSRQGRGLAHFLAEQGYDVFIPDLRGKGRSWPPVSGWARYRVKDAVSQDIPAIVETIFNLKGAFPSYWVGHAWGGVLASSFLARYPSYRSSINGLVYFGTRRVAVDRNWSRLIWVDGLWGWLGGMFARFKGYIPGRSLRIGAENEFNDMQQESMSWLNGQPWVDPSDDFDYGKALSEGLDYPPALYFASASDLAFSSPDDVKGFMLEVGQHNGRLVVLGEGNGNKHDYSHVGMLTHPDAVHDHFPFMVNWMSEMDRLRQEAQIGSNSNPQNSDQSAASGK